MMIRTVIASSRLTNGLLRSSSIIERKQLLAVAKYRYQSTAGTQTVQSISPFAENFHREIVQAYTHNPIEGYIRNSPFEVVTVPNLPLDQYIWQNLPKWSNHIAAVCAITNRSYTYAKLRDHCAALAVRLQTKFNLNNGDVVAVCLPNIPEYPIAVFGAIEAGLVVTTVNPVYTVAEIEKQLNASRPKLIFCTPEIYETAKQAASNTKSDIKIVCIKTDGDDVIPDGSIDFEQIIDINNVDFSALKPHTRHPDDLVFLPYSSGTTGLPKGVMLSHNNIAVNCEQLNVKLGESPLVKETTADFQEVSLSVLPFFHIYGLTVLMIAKLALGTKIVTLPSFKPKTFLNATRDYKATMLHLVPPIILFLGSHDSVKAEDLASVQHVMSGAAPLGAMDIERMNQKVPHVRMVQGYGLTETSPCCLVNFPQSKNIASIGVPTSITQAKIVNINDPTAKGLPANETGELWVRGPQNMLGYFQNQKATDEMLVDGWIRTGDIAFYDDDGFFHITDRMKELIKVQGFQVPPAELEEILRSHPDITDAGVIGIPHEKHGESPRAVVVRREGTSITEADVAAFVAEKVVKYKHLTGGVQFVETIPKSATGKILRREIKADYLKNFQK